MVHFSNDARILLNLRFLIYMSNDDHDIGKAIDIRIDIDTFRPR